jgi:phage gp37-like protein
MAFLIFCINFKKFLGQMAHNVPAVYDVWAGIKGICEAKTARPNVPE